MKKLIIITSLATAIILLASYTISENQFTKVTIEKDDTIQEVLKTLGDSLPNHTLDPSIEKASPKIGEALFHKGFYSEDGVKSAKQSKHFVCTSCHNTVKEDPDLRSYNPQARLEYTSQKGLPFLQATSLYGAVDRRKFYNGDYYLKYGESVKKANNDLREAIQLCAVECAQGRELEDWELESILGYLWTIGLKMSDLNLSDEDWSRIQADAKDKSKHEELTTFITSFYMDHSPASFVAPPENRRKGYDLKGDPNNGKLIYDNSCKHCHENTRYSYFNLDDSPLTFKHLRKNFPKKNRYSLYNLIRNGTTPIYGKSAYMPRYTKEKMSDQQVEDLRAYIKKASKGKK